eukprot:8025506-Alexandrium_andersonii.AAC.1
MSLGDPGVRSDGPPESGCPWAARVCGVGERPESGCFWETRVCGARGIQKVGVHSKTLERGARGAQKRDAPAGPWGA